MVQNSLTTAVDDALKVSYESNGETVNLSPSLVRKYISTSPTVTEQEIMMFISLCKFQKLNPFLKEVYLIKYGNNPATMVVGKDVFIKRARKQKDFDGFQAGVIVVSEAEDVVSEREGTIVYDNETLVGGWAKVYVKGYKVPFYVSVSLDEYMGRKSDGSPNGQWTSKPATMIRKVALSQALREAFPLEMGGLYEAEEVGVETPAEPTMQVIGQPNASDLNAPAPTPVEPEPEEPPVAPNVQINTPIDDTLDEIQNRLFGGYEA